MAHDVTDFPGFTGTGVTPGVRGESVQVFGEPLCLELTQLNPVLNPVFQWVHRVLLRVIVAPGKKPRQIFGLYGAERCASGAAGSGSEARADAGCRRLHAVVRHSASLDFEPAPGFCCMRTP